MKLYTLLMRVNCVNKNPNKKYPEDGDVKVVVRAKDLRSAKEKAKKRLSVSVKTGRSVNRRNVQIQFVRKLQNEPISVDPSKEPNYSTIVFQQGYDLDGNKVRK